MTTIYPLETFSLENVAEEYKKSPYTKQTLSDGPASEKYLGILKDLARQCHADGISMLGGGAEANVFELFKGGKPLYAVIRMEPGILPGMKADLEPEDWEGLGESAKAQINRTLSKQAELSSQHEYFGPAFERYPGRLPAYLETIETVTEDTGLIGMRYTVMPKLKSFEEWEALKQKKEGFTSIADALKPFVERLGFSDRLRASGMSTSELGLNNTGIYEDGEGMPHPVFFDPGNKPHHPGQHTEQTERSERALSAISKLTPIHDDTPMREEIAADAKRLLHGEETLYAQRERAIDERAQRFARDREGLSR